MKKQPELFILAANNWLTEVCSLMKYGTYLGHKTVIKILVTEFGHLKTDQITREAIQRFIVKQNERLKPITIRRYLSTFKGIMEYADEHWAMPRVKMPKNLRPEHAYYTLEEVHKLLRVSREENKLLIMLLFETGCRIGEALALEDKDISNGTLHITKNVFRGRLQKTPKTDSSIRKLCISDTLSKEIGNRKGFIFGKDKPDNPARLGKVFVELCRRAGVEWKGFHAFRRGNITDLCNVLKVPERIVGYRVGHLSSGMTLGVYVQVNEGCDKQWIEEIEKYLWQKQETAKS